MKHISIDFEKENGIVKPMHAVNNGPIYKFNPDMRITNMDEYKEAGIPFARNHDAAFCSTYGGRHTVDVMNIFENFDADVDDPASYNFTETDMYLRVIEASGAECFYRLGACIEHGPKKYFTKPPKDPMKFARICEHIIRHYTEGWDNGFFMKITYWEIWNEADGSIYGDNKTTWSGTKEQFIELFRITFDHLKTCFPHLKIGGPSASNYWHDDFTADLLKSTKQPIDFYSWHCYTSDPEKIGEMVRTVRKNLDALGMENTESILAEWNYVRDWFTEAWEYSLRAERGLKGASFVAAAMCEGQNNPLDMLMYYDARPSGMNCLFEAYTMKPLKGYSVFHMYNRLYKLGTSVPTEKDGDVFDVFCAGAKDKKGNGALYFTRFCEDDNSYPAKINISVRGAACGEEGVKAEFYLLDEYHIETPMKERIYPTGDFEEEIVMYPNSTCLVRFSKE